MTLLQRIGNLPLAKGDCVVAWLRPERIRDPQTIRDCERILCADESVRYRRFLRETDRHRFLVAHALKRKLLGAILQRPPESLEFTIDHLGKPDLSGRVPREISFNLSHTTGLVACAVACTETVGIDVEDCSRAIDIEVGRSVYSAAEMNALRALSEREQPNRFFQLWTHKEAYSKARGLGFQLPMKQCEFHFSADQPVRACFGGDVHDSPERWWFVSRLIEPSHRCTLAIPITDVSSRPMEFQEFTELDLRTDSE